MTVAPDCRCPVCGGNANGSTPVLAEGAVPKLGDVAICAHCAAVLLYDGTPLRLRLPMGHERAELYGDDRVARARQVVLAAGIDHRRSASR
jgi:hypothetical protein